ncbi:hypothetical protein OG259_17370 [Streptomyces sp. NBC_00250]|uniref:hypothetical protein n=1 Tax=Streptomyces sp. NBC_00250 TaxID=2903641 RepID=UPI002E29B232|nr:hypothetical protein [Streptomyces sp. NBC_00250]
MSDAAKRTARTVLQSAVGIAVVLPAIVDASGVPATLPWVAGALAVAGGLARVMALDVVQTLLPSWLRSDAVDAGDGSAPAEGGADDRV